jgi:neutral amino acid transport system ATP-binding protein
MSLLEVDGVVAGYGEADILHGVSIQVEAGGFVTIIGPNGSGKSTLMKTIFGLLKPRSGAVFFDGRNITGIPTERLVKLGLSYVPQTNNVFPSLTIEENLEMGAFMDCANSAQRIQQMYALFPDLEKRRGVKAGRLSGGQRQMLALARAMMLEPRLLMLDEPSAGLSPIMTATVFDTLRRIRESGIAILVVEQNARASLSMSDRGYILTNGENRLEDEGRKLLDNPEVARLYLGG